jgi:hypothetical protein
VPRQKQRGNKKKRETTLRLLSAQFERMREAHVVLWWVLKGHRPTMHEAIEKLDLLPNIAENHPNDEPRMTRSELAENVVSFCGNVDEFWAWIPTFESFAQFFQVHAEWNRELFQRIHESKSNHE